MEEMLLLTTQLPNPSEEYQRIVTDAVVNWDIAPPTVEGKK